jgi:hypothetical protein
MGVKSFITSDSGLRRDVEGDSHFEEAAKFEKQKN